MKQIKEARYAIVFPGQGSQYVGMGLEIVKKFSLAEEIFRLAEQITNLAIRDFALFDSEDNLMKTSITQPCLLTTNIALYTVFHKNFPINPEFICGHSAGEYAALVAAGVLSFSDAMHLIQIRGSLMSKTQKGSMVALKRVTLQEVKILCKKAVQPGGVLVPANLNSPEQIVISGDDDSVEKAILYAFEDNIEVIPLPVSGAFHSPLMREAAQEFANKTHDVRFNDADVPVISNVTGQPVVNGCEWNTLLKKQMTSAVQWECSIRYIQKQGIKTFIELGPGQVLSKLIRKIIPSALILNVEDINSLQNTLTEMEKIIET